MPKSEDEVANNKLWIEHLKKERDLQREMDKMHREFRIQHKNLIPVAGKIANFNPWDVNQDTGKYIFLSIYV